LIIPGVSVNLLNMQTKNTILDVIAGRVSHRTFEPMPLRSDLRRALGEALALLPAPPFGAQVRIAVADVAAGGVSERLGTYGVVRGARHFLVGCVGPGTRDLEDFGFVFEAALLHATDLGLGTCWIGGTFSQADFTRVARPTGGERIPAVSPVGVPLEKRSLVDSALVFFAGSRKRKPWTELFFDGDRQHPMTEAAAGPYARVLAAVRAAPSASNRQPWRIVRSRADGRWHLGLQRTPGYYKLTPCDLQRVDMGIAMCHFALAAEACGLPGRWVSDPGAGTHLGGWEYTASWFPG
jgi:nitroreductase